MAVPSVKGLGKERLMNIIEITPDDSGNIDWPLLSTDKKSVITVGSFDGVHRGHRAVLETVVRLAKQHNAFSVAIMFEPRPAFVHSHAADAESQSGDTAEDTLRISSVDQRLRVMNELGMDYVIIVHYTLEFADKSFRFFLGQLVGKLGMRTLVLGADASMGAGRAGNVESIERLAQATGMFELVVVDNQGKGRTRVPRTIEPQAPQTPGDPGDLRDKMTKTEFRAWSKGVQSNEVRDWSSSNVRFLLSRGAVREANEILGANHGVEGTVEHGAQRGRELGFPTANVGESFDGYLPVDGVYAGWLIDLGPADSYENNVSFTSRRVDDAAQAADHAISHPYQSGGVESVLAKESPYRWKAAISIGTDSTFDEDGTNRRTLEAYAITDDWIDLYDHRVRVEFEHFLRPQHKFDSADALKAQLSDDVQDVERLISE